METETKTARAKKAAKKQTPAPKAKGTAKKPAATKKAPASARVTKTDRVLEMLREKGGATAAELMKETGWQAHSLRGFISGACKKKLGLDVKSEKNEAGERVYSLEA